MDASPPRPLALAPRLHPRAGPHPSAARRHLTRRILTDDQPRARANPDALDAGRKPLAGACAEALATAHDGKSLKPRGHHPGNPTRSPGHAPSATGAVDRGLVVAVVSLVAIRRRA